jgi:tetratricopeptide (TPR) repeat protein
MEFEQYLERDILTFLDSKIYKKENTSIDREEEYGLYLTKDYLKELNYALDNDELTRAKKLFDELKANYSRLPKSSVERKKIYSLLEKMYEKIQNYVRIKEGKIEVIKQGDMEVFKDNTEKFSSLTDKMEKTLHETTLEDIKKPELSKKTELPISLDANSIEYSKKHPSEDEIFLEEKKHPDKHSVAVEANISGSTIKDKLEKHKTKEKEYIGKVSEKSHNEDIFKTDTQILENHQTDERRHETTHKQTGPVDWKNEIIDKTAIHLEKLKMHVTDKLLEELRKKLDENSDEQNKKIESIRKDIVQQVIAELDKRLKKEKSEVSNKMEHLRGEILNKVYHQAQHIISSKDNQNNADSIVVENFHIEDSVSNQSLESPIVQSDVVRFVRDNSLDKFESEANKKQISLNKYSGEELRVVYEQAIYYMFDNKYNEAAKLFRKIITVQPNNKAAHIRLQECIEKQPELSLSKNIEIIPDSEFKTIIKPQQIESNEENVSSDPEIEINGDIDEFKDTMTQNINTFADDIQKLQKYNIKHKYNDEELQKMYEEAVYTMFQSNYDEAAKIFQQILRIRPENKAARIRLQECKEAIGNA